MEWPTVSADEALLRLKRGARAVDVRSHGEFEKGHIPCFRNVAILNDDHRHRVGLIYKNFGQNAAVEMGHELVNPLRATLVNEWRCALDHKSAEMRLLTCWRGGLRSRISAQWLQESGFEGVRVLGGYKQMRSLLLASLERPPEFLVVGGLTGCGKTALLRELPQDGVLDLEKSANHRGSSFGLDVESVQPAQQTFENAVGQALWHGPSLMAVEAESRMIGKCSIPGRVKEAMDDSPLVVLETTLEDRVQRIFAEYVEEPLRKVSAEKLFAHLRAALLRVERRLGGLRHQEIQRLLARAFADGESLALHAPWIESLLSEYYDPQYEYALQSKARPVVFRGDYAAVKDYLTHRFDRRRS